MPQRDWVANTNIAPFVLTLGLYTQRHDMIWQRPRKDAVWTAVDDIWDQLGEYDPDAAR